jgi:hypothetical protein
MRPSKGPGVGLREGGSLMQICMIHDYRPPSHGIKLLRGLSFNNFDIIKIDCDDATKQC